MNSKKSQQFVNNNIFFRSYLKDCNKLIVCNFFLSLGIFFLLFKTIETIYYFQHNSLFQWEMIDLSDLGVDTWFPVKIIGEITFSIFLLSCSLIYIFWLRYKTLSMPTNDKLDFLIWNFYFALIPFFGFIYLFVWTKVMKKKYSIKTQYSCYHSFLFLIIINMLLIIVYWISSQHFCYKIPTIFDLFILPVKAAIGWVSFFYNKPYSTDLLYQYPSPNRGAIFCILFLLLVACYSLVASTSTFDAIINKLVLKIKGETTWIIIVPMIVVCLLSHFLGMYHEIIIFYPIYGKFLLLVGFDLLTIFYVFFLPITIGYGTSLFNPQIINFLKLPINPWSKMGVHIQFFLLFSLLTISIFFVTNYAKKIHCNLAQSVVYDTTIAMKNKSDFLQKNLVLTKKRINNFKSFIFVFLFLLLTNHNWFYYFSDFYSNHINFLNKFFFWIFSPAFHFISYNRAYVLDEMPLLPNEQYLYLQSNYWIILCYCFFFLLFNHKEINWQSFFQNFKNFFPFVIAIILCKAIEINFCEHGLFPLIIFKSNDFLINESFNFKMVMIIFLIFISLSTMVNPLLGSGNILLESINHILIAKGIGYATHFHSFLSSTIIVNLLMPTSFLLPFLIHHKISYFTYIKSSWKIILSLIFIISCFVCCHKYILS